MIRGLMDALQAASESFFEDTADEAASACASSSLGRGTPLSPRAARSAGRPASPDTGTTPLPAPRTAALPPPSPQVSSYQVWQERAKDNTVAPGTYRLSRVGKELVPVFGGGIQACLGAAGAAGATVMLASAFSGRTGDKEAGVEPQVLALAAGPVLAGAATGVLSGVMGALRKGHLTQPEALRETFSPGGHPISPTRGHL